MTDNIISSIRIFIIGYFGHSNIGDQQYLLTFNYIFKTFLINNNNYTIHYLDCDHVKITQFQHSDIIILGGGDILNDYFLDQIISKFINKPNKILAVSVGLPYTDILLNTNKLNIIDYIFIRSQQDINLFKQYFHPHRIFFIPDISFFLIHYKLSSHKQLTYNNNNNNLSLIQKHLENIKNNFGKKIIAITLSRHIFHSNYTTNYFNILQSFVKFIKYLLTFNYYIVLLPFNTNENGNNENDILIHNDIMNILNDSPNITCNIMNLTTHLEPLEILDLYQYFYITIPMRFHATLFSIYTNVPVLPVFTTRKIKNLLLDINWTHYHKLECNEKDIPTTLDELSLIQIFRNIIDNHTQLSNNLTSVNRDFFTNNFNNTSKIINLISCNYSKSSFTLDINTKDTKINNLYYKLQDMAQIRNLPDFRLITDKQTQTLITQIVSYYLTNGTIESTYNYGLLNKMFNINYNYKDEWSWIITDNNKKYIDNPQTIFNNPYGLFNINYIDQIDYSNAHRSGWQFVYDNIKYLHNDSSNLYLDLYIDRTFHWNKDINKALGLIPYKKNWIGFIHHTFDTSFSEYNNHNLLNNPDFIQSLQFCKGIFVLSKYLRTQFITAFYNKNIFVPVYDLTHPTDINVPKFTYRKFLNNKDKKLIHIGGWLRNIYSFYDLNIPSICSFIYKNRILFNCYKQDTIRKVALKGAFMNNYYPSPDLANKLQTHLTLENSTQNCCTQNCQQNCCTQNISQNICQNISQNICQNVSQNVSQNCQELRNNWYKHFYEHIKYMCNSIDFIDKVSNDDYDTLLTENIVFINLVDASAVNTIIECIVRNTPIIVNNHPAVIELLGKNYPLYFNDNYTNYFEMNQEIVNILTNPHNIKKAYKYLCKLDKSKFNINNFNNNFINYIQHI